MADVERHALYAGVVGTQQFVGAILNPAGDIGVRRTAVGRVVLEATVFRRVVRGSDNDAVGKMVFAAAVVNQNRVRYDGGGRDSVVLLNDGFDVVGGQNLERGALRRAGQRVGVLAHVKRAVGSLPTPILADGLRDCQDMGFGKGVMQR